MNILRGAVDRLRDTYAPVSHTSTFRASGQITPEEFLTAGDFLVYKFPTWSWSDASPTSKRVSYLPPGKQFLVTRGVPCHRRLNEHFAEHGAPEDLVKDALGGEGGDDDDGWLRTGGMTSGQEGKVQNVQTLDASGNVGEIEVDEEIPDMEDEDDDEEAIIRDPAGTAAGDT